MRFPLKDTSPAADPEYLVHLTVPALREARGRRAAAREPMDRPEMPGIVQFLDSTADAREALKHGSLNAAQAN